VTPWRACAGAGSWQDLWPHGERSPRWSRFAGRACDPVRDPCWSTLFLKDCAHAGAVWEELQPMGRSHTGEVNEGLSPVGGTPC